MVERSKQKPRPGDHAPSRDKDIKDDPKSEHGAPLAKPAVSDHEQDEEDEEMEER